MKVYLVRGAMLPPGIGGLVGTPVVVRIEVITTPSRWVSSVTIILTGILVAAIRVSVS